MPMPPRPATPSMRQPASSLPRARSVVWCVSVGEGTVRAAPIIAAGLIGLETMSELEQAVETVVGRCLGIRAGEQVVVVADRETRQLGDALRDAAERAGAEAVLCTMEPRETHGQEPPAPVAA